MPYIVGVSLYFVLTIHTNYEMQDQRALQFGQQNIDFM